MVEARSENASRPSISLRRSQHSRSPQTQPRMSSKRPGDNDLVTPSGKARRFTGDCDKRRYGEEEKGQGKKLPLQEETQARLTNLQTSPSSLAHPQNQQDTPENLGSSTVEGGRTWRSNSPGENQYRLNTCDSTSWLTSQPSPAPWGEDCLTIAHPSSPPPVMTSSRCPSTKKTRRPSALKSTLAGGSSNRLVSSTTMESPARCTAFSQLSGTSDHSQTDTEGCNSPLQQSIGQGSPSKKTSRSSEREEKGLSGDSSLQRCAPESMSTHQLQWGTIPGKTTSKTLGGTAYVLPGVSKLSMEGLRYRQRSMCRMTASTCVEKLDVPGAVSSTTQSTVGTPTSDVLANEAVTSLQPMFFMRCSIDAPPLQNGKVTASEDKGRPMPFGLVGPPGQYNPFQEPFSEWECRRLLSHPCPKQPSLLTHTIDVLEIDANL